MKNKFSLLNLTLTAIVVALLFACALPALAADDSNLSVSQTNAVVDATNYTASIDLGTTSTSQIYRTAYLRGAIPALTLNTNAAKTLLFTVQHSANNSTWSQTSPLIQAQLAGVTSTGSTATNFLVPIPPTVNRYIRIQQITPTLAGDSSNKTNVWSLVVP